MEHEKRAFREKMLLLRKKIKIEEKKEMDSTILQHLFGLPEYQNCRNVLTYVSYNMEADTKAVIQQSFGEKAIFVPKVLDKTRMDFYRICCLEKLVKSKKGILEPVPFEADRFQMCCGGYHRFPVVLLIPGLAFDRHKNRLGYGGGYYDRYLASFKEYGIPVVKIALLYECQFFERIPASDKDEKMDILITNQKVIR